MMNINFNYKFNYIIIYTYKNIDKFISKSMMLRFLYLMYFLSSFKAKLI
jgi:hypothetical protein